MAFNFPSSTSKNYLQAINQNAPDAGAALKVLSLNLPNFLGGSPIAPDALLRPGLSTAAQVGGTGTGVPPSPAPASASPAPTDGSAPLSDAGPSPVTPAPGLPPQAGGVSPFSTAPIAALAANALAPNPTSPGTPRVETSLPTPDVFGGGQAPVPSPRDSNGADVLSQLLAQLFQGTGSSNEPDQGHQLI